MVEKQDHTWNFRNREMLGVLFLPLFVYLLGQQNGSPGFLLPYVAKKPFIVV